MTSKPSTGAADRLVIHSLGHSEHVNTFADDVRVGLTRTPKTLPPKYFYDALGSRLFEAICCLPEYYLTRAESEILRNLAGEIVAAVRGPVRLLELGSGNAEKTRYLIEALLARQAELHYLPVDISGASLELTSKELLRLYPQLRITAYVADYFTALEMLGNGATAARLNAMGGATRERTIALFLGSNIGNFGPDESRAFLRQVRRVLGPGDALLLGADLKKPAAALEPAYDDPLGVTAAFNLNVLVRINRELDANFNVSEFKHRALYNEALGRIEMHLESGEAQTVRINGLDVDVSFKPGETIHTENSYKFDVEQLSGLAQETGFSLDRTWFDSERWFSFNLFACADHG